MSPVFVLAESAQSLIGVTLQAQAGETMDSLEISESRTGNVSSEQDDGDQTSPLLLSQPTKLPWDSGSWGSVVADLLVAFEESATMSLTSATTAIEKYCDGVIV